MRILTVRQPWAWAIIHGGKDVENRVRNIAGDYRGPVAIHVAQKPAGISYRDYHMVTDAGYDTAYDKQTGAIIGVVDLVDVHDGREESLHALTGEVIATHSCSPWAEVDAWHLELANPQPLADPIPYRGALGLRRLDADTIALIEAGLT